MFINKDCNRIWIFAVHQVSIRKSRKMQNRRERTKKSKKVEGSSQNLSSDHVMVQETPPYYRVHPRRHCAEVAFLLHYKPFPYWYVLVLTVSQFAFHAILLKNFNVCIFWIVHSHMTVLADISVGLLPNATTLAWFWIARSIYKENNLYGMNMNEKKMKTRSTCTFLSHSFNETNIMVNYCTLFFNVRSGCFKFFQKTNKHF